MEFYPGGIQILSLIIYWFTILFFLFIFLFLSGVGAVTPSECKLPEGRVPGWQSGALWNYTWIIAWSLSEGNSDMRRLGPHFPLCKSSLVTLEGPGLSLRYWDSGGDERWC